MEDVRGRAADACQPGVAKALSPSQVSPSAALRGLMLAIAYGFLVYQQDQIEFYSTKVNQYGDVAVQDWV